MGKLKIPKAKQIKGLRKAIANRRTPRQFLPSLKKRLAKLTATAAILFAIGCVARPAVAQTPVIVQPTQQTLAPAGTACTGSPQVFPVNNKNQSIHYAYIIPSANTQIYMEIDGLDTAGNPYRISDLDAVAPLTGIGFNGFELTGYGYYPTVQVSVTCAGAVGSFTMSYSGSSSSSVNVVGSYQTAQVAKIFFNGASLAGLTGATSPNIQTPFANSLGLINAQVSNVGGAAAGLSINCISLLFNTALTPFTYLVPGDGQVHQFPVPASTCPIMQVQVNQKASAFVTLEYLFEQTGFQNSSGPGNSYVHVTAATATIIKNGSGTLFTLNINTPAVGTISLFDLISGSCTGTPSTNAVALINVTSTSQIESMNYGALFQNGICIKSSVAMDLTAVYQ